MENLSVDQYYVPANTTCDEIKVKGSRFLASVFHCIDKEEAENVYAKVKQEFYDATHNCFAYRINEQIFRYSDDGEPSGTAGRPILQVIDGSSFVEILVVVTRYFGGTKLGTGGLVRAYGESARYALNKTKIEIRTRFSEIKINYAYQYENIVRQLLTHYHGKISNQQYGEQVLMKLAIPQSKMNFFKKDLVEMTNNEIEIIK